MDSGAEPININIPLWIEDRKIHPKLSSVKTSSKLASVQATRIKNYEKLHLLFTPTGTMEQIKL